jgi:putative Mg2+ transporter-C (MgtC) family protein
MQTLSVADFALRLAVGVGCGVVIGLERQWRARMAGLRTNALVAGGATLFVLYAAATEDSSPTRVASYVVSGIGFLGGGVILRQGVNVRGLNTAATLWCSAAVGVLAASGHLVFTLIATGTVIAIHVFGRPLGRLIDHDHTVEKTKAYSPTWCRCSVAPNRQSMHAPRSCNTPAATTSCCGVFTRGRPAMTRSR